ncbi:MAG: T9SS type A sorting domain-containing protein [Ignavibacteriales bacterium]|nr:T9SS type A sorting domain-containing protein [Ignavibacteriales bacterium]
MEVIDGDFVSKNPTIKISLSDESPIPIVDTTAVKIYLNEEPVYYGANQDKLSYTINSSNPKFVAEYKPDLADGDYLLRVVAKDPNGNAADSASSEVYFVVSSETKLLQVYNYPNPFANETYFTFRLSQIPEEVKIRIYTIAGRLIKEISRQSSELNYDLNKIYWDGKDEDGDVIANGTYLYKMIMKDEGKVESVTQKLVIIK